MSHHGELVVIDAWPSQVTQDRDAAFTIVLSQQPRAEPEPAPPPSNIVVCLPATPVRLPAIAAEGRSSYDAGSGDEAFSFHLPPDAAAAYAQGEFLAGQPLGIEPGDVFSASGAGPRLRALALALVAAARRADACWRALQEALALPEAPPRPASPERLRAMLGDLLRRVPAVPADVPGAGAVDRLRAVVERGVFEQDAPDLKEDAAFARCLLEQPNAALELAASRAYLDEARPAPHMRELLADRAFIREQLSFVTLLCEPHQLDSMRATFDVFRNEYAAAYARHHHSYWRGFAPLRVALEEAQPAAQALVRLNTLPALGEPAGTAALGEYERLMRRPFACPASSAAPALSAHPTCAGCALTMEEGLPAEEIDEVLRRVHNALTLQQTRLASEAVRRILARGGERIEQLLQIVQASDIAALTHILDDELLGFLRELLAEPLSPAPEALDLLQELIYSHPTVSEREVDAVTATLRRLLLERLATQRAAEPGQPAAIQLGLAPPASP